MRRLHVTSEPHPDTARLLERRASPHGTVTVGEVRAIGGHVLYAHHHLPVLVPDPLPREVIAADFTPGR